MKWFQVDASTPEDPRLLEIVSRLKASRDKTDPPDEFMAMAVYGILLLTWCFAAKQERARPGTCEYGDGRPIPPAVVAESVRVDLPFFLHVMEAAAEVGHIDRDAWSSGLIKFPAMERRADTYTARKAAGYYDRAQQRPAFDVESEVADRLLDGRWLVQGFEPGSLERRVRVGSGYADIVAESQDGSKRLVVVVKRTRITAFAVSQALRYCREMDGKQNVPVVVGFGGVVGNVRAAARGVLLYTYDAEMNVISHGKQSEKSHKISAEKSKGNTPVPVPVPVVGDFLGEEAPQLSALIALWNQTRQPGPKVVGAMNSARVKKIRAALRVSPNLADWKQAILWINGQAWMNAGGTGVHQSWRADLDYLARPGMLAKHLEQCRLDKQPSAEVVGRDPKRGRTGVKKGKYDHLRVNGDEISGS